MLLQGRPWPLDIVQRVLLGNVTASLSADLKIKVRYIKQNYTAN